MFLNFSQNLGILFFGMTIGVVIMTIVSIIIAKRKKSSMGSIIEEFKKTKRQFSFDWFTELKLSLYPGYYYTEVLIGSVKITLAISFNHKKRHNSYSITVDFRKWAKHLNLSSGQYELFLIKLDYEINKIRIGRNNKIASLMKPSDSQLVDMQGIFYFNNFDDNELVELTKIIKDSVNSFEKELVKLTDSFALSFVEDAESMLMQLATSAEIEETNEETQQAQMSD